MVGEFAREKCRETGLIAGILGVWLMWANTPAVGGFARLGQGAFSGEGSSGITG